MSYAPSVIKSIQRGTITFVAGDNETATATITAVVTAKSVLSLLGIEAAGLFFGNLIRITLTNTTTITASRESDSSSAANVVGFVITEYY